MQYRVISTDDHLQEAPHTWNSRMSSTWGARVPQVRRLPDGTDRWFIFDRPAAFRSLANVGGAMADRNARPQRWEEVPERAYVPSERLKAMEQDGVDAHTLFGNTAGIAGNTLSDPSFDEQFRIEAIRAYNDYQVEEWATPYPGRFITLAIVPMWDVGKAVEELRRACGLGMKGVSFAFPQQFGYPHIADRYWDPLWGAIQDAGVPLNFHVGAGIGPDLNTNAWGGRGAPFLTAEASVRIFSANTAVMSTILYSGILERFPTLKIVSAESGLGWVPYVLEVADHQWERQRLWESGMQVKPSDLFHRQCYVNFWFEVVGVKMREYVGLDNIMWESDYPHPTCTYPTSQEYIRRVTEELTPEERRQILVGNAARLYRLDTDSAFST